MFFNLAPLSNKLFGPKGLKTREFNFSKSIANDYFQTYDSVTIPFSKIRITPAKS